MSLRSLALIVALPLASCATMRAEIDIHASRERVWEELSKIREYPEWNPFFVQAAGPLRAGESLEVTMQPVGKDAQTFSPTVLEVKPGERLVWRGRLLLPGLFDGQHHFILEERCPGSVRFRQVEEFSGMLVPFADFEPYHRGWLRMNAALKARAEAPRTRTRSD